MSSQVVKEHDGALEIPLTLSRPLPFNISIKFLYDDLTAVGKLVM